MSKNKYIRPVAVIASACKLENRICDMSLLQNSPSTVGFEKVEFKEPNKDGQSDWDSSWLQ